MDPLELTLIEAATALRTRQLGHLEYAQALLRQADRLADLNVWISRDPERLIQQANALDQNSTVQHGHSPLAGIPLAIKDNIDLAGLSTTAGCREYAYTPAKSAFVVQRLIDAGAIPIGKTNLDQFATGLNGTRSPYGACRNAFNPDFVSGFFI